MARTEAVEGIIKSLHKFYKRRTMLEQFSHERDKALSTPFAILISTILSARARDTQTIPIVKKLFQKYSAPEDFLAVPLKILQKDVYGTGFYKVKAKRVKDVCKALIERHKGKVPNDLDSLLSLPGVGRKTANCVLVYAFRKPAIPVDTHVHRIANRLGWVKTKTPEQTEAALLKIVPKKHWVDVNELLVTHGQTICAPISPFCSKCPVAEYCPKVGVSKQR